MNTRTVSPGFARDYDDAAGDARTPPVPGASSGARDRSEDSGADGSRRQPEGHGDQDHDRQWHRAPRRDASAALRSIPAERHDTNVGTVERLVAATVGLSAIGLGLVRRGPLGWAAAGAGTILALHGLKSHSPAYAALGIGGDDADTWSNPLSREVHSRSSITIDATPSKLYEIWSDTAGLARFHPHVASIDELGGNRSRWDILLPNGRTMTYEAVVTETLANRRIQWASVPGAPLDLRGSITFTRHPSGRGTVVAMQLRYHLPGGALGALLAKATDTDPGRDAAVALGRLKQFVETGEISSNRGPTERGSGWSAGSTHDTRARTHGIRPEDAGASDENSGTRTGTGNRDERRDRVDEAIDESFPASDPPSWTATTAASRGSDRNRA